MTRKTNTMLIALLGTILTGLATWTLVTLIELQLIVTMIQSDLMSIDLKMNLICFAAKTAKKKHWLILTKIVMSV